MRTRGYPGSSIRTLFSSTESRADRAMFVRHDVFTALREQRPEGNFRALAWYSAVTGWALAHPEVRILNRGSALHSTNKVHVLHVARAVGLLIPSTRVTNDFRALSASRDARIAKPINGGDYARDLSDAMAPAEPREGALAARPSFKSGWSHLKCASTQSLENSSLSNWSLTRSTTGRLHPARSSSIHCPSSRQGCSSGSPR